MPRYIVMIDSFDRNYEESGVMQPWVTAPAFDSIDEARVYAEGHRQGRRAEIHESESGEMKDARVVERFTRA